MGNLFRLMAMNKKVGIKRCSSYDPEEVYNALKLAVELSGGLDVAGKTVLLKPNIVSDAAPEKAITTHPVFLEAAIRLVREMGSPRILVGDGPGLQGPAFSAKTSGLGEAASKNGAEWVDFTKEKMEAASPEGKVIKKFTLTMAAKEADLIISLPKLKVHQLMYFTGAMKNTFGLIPSLIKSTLHVRFPSRQAFAAMLVDLNLAVKPAYAFMDAVIGMERTGPSAGDPRHIGLVFASSNLLAMDIAAASIIGYPPLLVPVNREAFGRKYWLSDLNEIEYPGLSPADVQIRDFVKVPITAKTSQLIDFILPRPVRKLKESFEPGPEINYDTCVRCGDCARICASKAITLLGEGKEGRIVIDYKRCIRCFCCHEICTVKAIDISKRRPKNVL